jgi:asparagine synthase (glutamine-hydrolysing)
VAGSVPRVLFAAGIERKIDDHHMADSLLYNLSDPTATWFEGVSQVPVGSVVEIDRGGAAERRSTYNIHHIPMHRPKNDAEAIATVSELLDEGVRACMRGFERVGVTLSAGLDSPQVAVRALAALPEGSRLPTFTFHPQAQFKGRSSPGKIANERPMVERFAALHPGLEPHFVDNAGRGHDYRATDMFHLVGSPKGLNTMYVFHGVLEAASREGCDAVLLAEWGDLTFSDHGQAGFVENFLLGRWRQLCRALLALPADEGGFWRRFTTRTLAALLPNRLWLATRGWLYPGRERTPEIIQPLRSDFREASGANERLAASGLVIERYQPRSRRHSRRLLFGNGDPAEIYQGFEQMYGVALRDPTAYRPLVEYCLGLPTRMFMRNGQMRWLARQMARGIMPEKQRMTTSLGIWDADGLLRVAQYREAYRETLNRIASDDGMSAIFDVDRLRGYLDALPAEWDAPPEERFGPQIGVPAAVLAARFVKYVEGSNQP